MLECFPLRMAFSKSSCNGVIQSCTLEKGGNLIVGEGVVICSPAAGYTNLSPSTRPNPINMTKARNILLFPRKQRKRINADKQTFLVHVLIFFLNAVVFNITMNYSFPGKSLFSREITYHAIVDLTSAAENHENQTRAYVGFTTTEHFILSCTTQRSLAHTYSR